MYDLQKNLRDAVQRKQEGTSALELTVLRVVAKTLKLADKQARHAVEPAQPPNSPYDFLLSITSAYYDLQFLPAARIGHELPGDVGASYNSACSCAGAIVEPRSIKL